MNKDELLQKSRDDNRNGDERDQMIQMKSWEYGHKTFFLVACLIAVLNLILTDDSFITHELMALTSAFTVGESAYMYHKIKKHKYLLSMLGWLSVLILSLVNTVRSYL